MAQTLLTADEYYSRLALMPLLYERQALHPIGENLHRLCAQDRIYACRPVGEVVYGTAGAVPVTDPVLPEIEVPVGDRLPVNLGRGSLDERELMIEPLAVEYDELRDEEAFLAEFVRSGRYRLIAHIADSVHRLVSFHFQMTSVPGAEAGDIRHLRQTKDSSSAIERLVEEGRAHN